VTDNKSKPMSSSSHGIIDAHQLADPPLPSNEFSHRLRRDAVLEQLLVSRHCRWCIEGTGIQILLLKRWKRPFHITVRPIHGYQYSPTAKTSKSRNQGSTQRRCDNAGIPHNGRLPFLFFFNQLTPFALGDQESLPPIL